MSSPFAGCHGALSGARHLGNVEVDCCELLDDGSLHVQLSGAVSAELVVRISVVDEYAIDELRFGRHYDDAIVDLTGDPDAVVWYRQNLSELIRLWELHTAGVEA